MFDEKQDKNKCSLNADYDKTGTMSQELILSYTLNVTF